VNREQLPIMISLNKFPLTLPTQTHTGNHLQMFLWNTITTTILSTLKTKP